MCCATTAKANDVGENINYKYNGETEVGMSIYMDDVSVARNKKICKNESGEKNEIQLSKTKYMVVKTGKRWKKISQNK